MKNEDSEKRMIEILENIVKMKEVIDKKKEMTNEEEMS